MSQTTDPVVHRDTSKHARQSARDARRAHRADSQKKHAPRRQFRATTRRPQSRSEARRARQRAAAQAESRTRRAALTPLGTLLAIVALIAVVAGVVLVTGFLTPPASPPKATPPADAQVVVRSQSSSVAFEGARGWVSDDSSGTTRPFDPVSGALGRATRTGGRPISLTASQGRVWVADISGSRVSAVSTRTGRVVVGPVSVPQGPVSIAVGDGGVWVASLLSGTLSLLDSSTGQVRASVVLPDGAVRLAIGDGYVWVTGQTDILTRVFPRPLGQSLQWESVRVGQGPIGVAVGGGAVWVVNAQSGTLTRVDPRELRVTGTFPVASASSDAVGANGAAGADGSAAQGPPGAGGSDPETVAFWRGDVWVGGGQTASVVAVDPRTGAQVGAAVDLPGVARDLVVGYEGDLWAATANPGRVVRIVPR